MRDRDDRIGDGARPVLPWRMVAAAFLHFGLLAYLIVVPMLCLLTAPRAASAEQILRLALHQSGRFLLVMTAAGITATLGAALIDPLFRARRLRRALRDPRAPEAASQRDLDSAIAIARAQLEASLADRVADLAGAGWDFGDRRFVALARDLAEVVRTAAAALASAKPERRHAIETMTATSLDHLAQELGELSADRARRDEAEAATAARYVELRYGGSDFAIRRD